ncbi:MAG: biotin--[acetyl-CoA-carboxylase] ligase [Alicyclobacillus sp.]|nr:biotin--[acetyl-CoA-carboxylase] ligase [Alicyclobacillus sp.]
MDETTLESSRFDVRQQVLSALLAADGAYVSGAELSRRSGVSRTAVWKHMQALQRLGFVIDSAPHKGYRLQQCPDVPLAPLLAPLLPDVCTLGRHVVWLDTVPSTNAYAADLARQGAPHGTLVVAREQTGGRGRHGRSWYSPPGGLWMSLVLRRPLWLQRAAELTLLACVAVRRAILHQTGLAAGIKWPNDLLFDGRKVCGILAEVRAEGEQVEYAVLGIGVNNRMAADQLPDDLRQRATTLTAHGANLDNTSLCAAILTELDPLYLDLTQHGRGFAAVAAEWRAASVTLGAWVRVQTPHALVEGQALRVDDSGTLYVQTAAGQEVPVHSGDVLFDA